MNETNIDYCECPDFGFYLITNRVICIRCNRWKPPGYEPNPHLYKQPPKDSVSQSKEGEESKEEILDQYYQKGMHWTVVNRKNVLAAMEEYAQQFQSKENEGKQAGVMAKHIEMMKTALLIVTELGEEQAASAIQSCIDNAELLLQQPIESGERGEVERLKKELEMAELEIQRLTYLIHEK